MTFEMILALIIALIDIAFSIYSFIVCKSAFLNNAVFSALNVLALVFVSFILSQNIISRRKKKDAVCRIILTTLELVSDEKMYRFENTSDSREIMLRNRRINNHLNLLREDSKAVKIQEEVETAQKQFNDYKDFISNYFPNIDQLSEHELEVKKLIELLEHTLYSIFLKLSC